MQESIRAAVGALDEPELTRAIVEPLLSTLHPGSIEYTHSATEAGRDLVSFGRDALGREHVLCSQVKATKLSYGAREFGSIAATARTARSEGVTLQDGRKIIPHEVWVISSQPFTEHERRQVSDTILALAREGIKIVAGDELCRLLVEKLPKVAAKLSRYADSAAASLIALLSRHAESRAFGLPYDRSIEEFYVCAALAPEARLAYSLLRGAGVIPDFTLTAAIPIDRLLSPRELKGAPSQIAALIQSRLRRQVAKDPLVKRHPGLNWSITLRSALRDAIKEWRRPTIPNHDRRRLWYTAQFQVRDYVQKLVRDTKTELAKCPPELGANPRPFLRAHKAIEKLDRAAGVLLKAAVQGDRDQATNQSTLLAPIAGVHEASPRGNNIRVRIPNPTHALRLSDLLLIEGPPGCGKTTFTKILAIRLLDSGERVLFVPCGGLSREHMRMSLSRIVSRASLGAVGRRWRASESILILDGLDECPFAISRQITRGKKRFKKVVASTRTAFETPLRERALTVALSPFSADERDEFFAKWFREDDEALRKANALVRSHDDIDYHTRLPLIATITAALVGKGYQPTTRAEIYDQRLRLLLSQWDHARGVRRLAIGEDRPKRRFLAELAYVVHSARERRRVFTGDDIQKAYAKALGEWGYEHKLEDLLSDLTAGSGIIIQEGEDSFSFGHLSFQEHLVGEYLHEKRYSATRLKALMGDDWWKEPLIFYAAIKGDITELIRECLKTPEVFAQAGLLSEMARYAPFTSPGAREMLVDTAAWARTEDERLSHWNRMNVDVESDE